VVRRSRIYGYSYSYVITARLGKYEKAMLDKLIEYWRQREGDISESEAVRRCIVFTFSKWVVDKETLSEESLLKALSIALGGLADEDRQSD
jgi:hypothetical protein